MSAAFLEASSSVTPLIPTAALRVSLASSRFTLPSPLTSSNWRSVVALAAFGYSVL